MKTIKQTQIADYIGVSPQMVCDIRKGRRRLSKEKSKKISIKTGIPFEDIALGGGDELYKKMVFAYQQQEAVK